MILAIVNAVMNWKKQYFKYIHNLYVIFLQQVPGDKIPSYTYNKIVKLI